MIIPILGVIFIFGAPGIAIIILIIRLTSSTNKERMEMIKRGMIPPEKIEHTPSRLRTLRAGMGGIGGGIGALVSLLAIEYCFQDDNVMYQMLIILGSVLFFFGIAFVIYYIISKDKIDSEV